jgi:hypothetical protein
MRRSALVVAVSAMALTTILTSTSGFAQMGGGWDSRHVAFPHRGWSSHGYRGGRNWGGPLTANVVGGPAMRAFYGYPASSSAYGYSYDGTVYAGAPNARAPGLTRNSSCADVRARPSLYSESGWASCGLDAADPTDWGPGVVR